MATEVTDATFDREIAASSAPVVVEFFATWCGNCHRVAPVLTSLAADHASLVRFMTVDVDQNPALVARFGVSATPALFVLDGERQVASVVGAQSEAALRGLFEAAAEHVTSGVHAALRWVPAGACTLPTADMPLRLAEFDALFATSLQSLERKEPGWLRLRLADGEGVEASARDLTARESECCSFFAFDVRPGRSGEVIVDVHAPRDRVGALDGLVVQATAALA